MLDTLLAALTDEVLEQTFGASTLDRALPYVRGRHIGRPRLTENRIDRLSAVWNVQGTRQQPYGVLLTVSLTPRTVVRSICACPVHHQCKHGAALALVLRGQSVTSGPAWEHELAGLLSETDAPDDDLTAPGPPKQLALQFNLTLPPARGARRTSMAAGIRVRPMREGLRRSWIKTGAGWPDLRSGIALGDHDPDQVDALSRLHAALVTGRGYWSQVERPYLHEFGPQVWRLLRHARDAGVTFQLSRPLAGLDLVERRVDVAVDLTRTPTGTAVRTGVEHDGEWWSGEDVMAIGTPAHGLALLRPVDSRARKGPTPHHVSLVELSRPLPPDLRRLLDSPAPVSVPTADWERFSTEHLPGLRRRFPVGSSDDSVVLPEAARPALHLGVTWATAVSATLDWEWRYAEPGRTRACALDSTERLGGIRDPQAERHLVAELVARHDLGLLGPGTGAPRAHQTLTGPAALALGEELLPELRDGGLVEVDESDPPDFREAESAPEIRFTAPGDEGSGGADNATTDWLDLEVSISVDGETVPLADVLAALTLGLPRIVLPSGLHLASDLPELRALRDLVESAAELRDRTGERIGVGAHDLGLWAQLADLGIVDAQAAAWVARAQALRDLTALPAVEPVGLASTLRGYQLDGFRWLCFLQEHGLGGILADDMGLGKTLQVLAMISRAREQGGGRFLVVAPTSVVSAWQSEAARHTPGLRVAAITASRARRTQSLAEIAEQADVVVTTYTLLRLEADAYAALPWAGLVLDEAQQVKNHQGKTYHAVRRIGAPFTLAVTGTPFENRLLELWSLLSITVPGLYPWPTKFTESVVVPVERNGDAAALRRFRTRIRPFVLRRTKELVAADLPPKQEQVLEVQLSAGHRRIYDTHLQRERQKVLGLVGDLAHHRVAVFSALTRLRQLALAPDLVDPEVTGVASAKIDVLVEHLREIAAEGHRALVFSTFTGFLRQVADRLEREGIAAAYLDGSTRRRGEVISGFKDGDVPVFLISLKAGGVGLTLTEADYVFVLDPWWNPAAEAQAVDRAHRIGQERSVMVYRLVAVDTIEEKVMALKARKAELFAQVLDGDGAFGTEITADDIRGLFED